MSLAMRTASSGMMAQQMMVDTIANNIANVNTAGFKKNRVNFRTLLYGTIREPGAASGATTMSPTGLQVGTGVEVSSSIKLFAQGNFQQTTNPLDMGISGDGFFEIQLPNGDSAYTRDGSFRRDATGRLVTVDGFLLLPQVTIPADAQDISIGQYGTVNVNINGSIQSVASINIVTFANPAGLSADGANMFTETVSSGSPIPVTPGQGSAGLIRQGFVERSNTAVVDELIELIQAQRNYEVNSRTIQVADEMLQELSNLL